MIKLFVPKMYIRNYKSLNLMKLKESGIKVLLCDIDNTLAPHDISLPDEDVAAFRDKVRSYGMELVLISNNTKKRVSLFAAHLGVSYYASSLKPLPYVYRKIKKRYQVKYEEIALLGDQLITDMSGANYLGIYPILSAPLVERDIHFTKINRIIERVLFKSLKNKGYLSKGEYYD